MVFSHILFLGHNKLKDFPAGEVNSRTTETSSSYGGGQHAFNYRGSITGKAPWHKGMEGKLRLDWAAQFRWAGEVKAASHLEEGEKEVQAVMIAANITGLIIPQMFLSAFSLCYLI